LSSLKDAANLSDAYGVSHGNESWTAWEKDFDDGNTVHAEVGSYRPNASGLHEVAGNVAEWCRDGYGGYDLPVRDGDGARDTLVAPDRVLRGGSYTTLASDARSAIRVSIPPEFGYDYLGLRPARAITP
jgi:formylglycine-generating enzyme required for sulfatase activity